MNVSMRILIVVATLATLHSEAVLAEIPSRQSTGGAHTTLSMVADVASIAPGSQCTVGIRMVMEDGWHTYWKFAGEAGLPTEITWTLPPGITPGEISWPIPHKYTEGGEIITFGYEHENLLMIPMFVSTDLKPGTTQTLRADVTWLECKNVCIPGKTTVELSLPVSARPPEAANTSLFTSYRNKTPQQLSQIPDLQVRWTVDKGLVRISVSQPGISPHDSTTLPDFFPEAIADVEIGRTSVHGYPDSAIIALPLSSYEKVIGPRVLRGIVVRLADKGMYGVRVEIPLDEQFCSSLPLPGTENGGGSVLDQPFESVGAQGPGLSLWTYLLFAVVGGLLLNIMPCVLPVIALKIFGLVGMAGDQPRRVRTLGVMFSLGILASFLALALLVIILQTAGQQVGWGFQFQEPAFVVVMCTIVFAFGLNLFGVYEITLPGAAVSGLGKVLNEPSKSRKSGPASFAEGVFATVLATPCTAPFLGTALGFAFAQPPWTILLIFTAVAFGMALPYLVLTSRPSWTKFLPKPGAWMERAKQFMGFLMMGTLIWLLYVLGRQLGMEAVIWTAGFLLMVGIACWIIGSFATLNATRTRHIVAWVVALGFLASGYWLFLDELFAAQELVGVRTNVQSSEGLQWRSFSRDELENTLKGSQTVFIDFTADWCLTCKVNEKSVLTDKSVVEKFKSLDVVAFKADWTTRNTEITALLAKFGRSGVPLYVIFPPSDRSRPIVLPEVITTGVVLEALDRATQRPSEAAR